MKSETFFSVHLTRLNGGTNFGMKSQGAVCDQLAERTKAPEGIMPLWGQSGEWTLDIRGMAVRIKWDGIYGTCGLHFGAYAVDKSKPFISETGYRSFWAAGYPSLANITGMTPDQLVRRIIEAEIDLPAKPKRAGDRSGLGGKLVWIDKEHGGPGGQPERKKSKR